MKILRPFEDVGKGYKIIVSAWILMIFLMWSIYSIQERHVFPTIPQVYDGFISLWNEGLITHIFSSIFLCIKSVLLSVLISLLLVYSSPIPILKPISTFISKFRYLPLTGIAFYITMLIDDGRSIQVWILVLFMTTYLVTSLLSTIKDIPSEEFDHARTLGCSRWEVLWEVVVKGRFDYVIESIRQNFAMIWFALVTVESIMAATGGIGFLIKNSDKFSSHGKIIALQSIILIIGISVDFILYITRKISFRYSKF